MDLTGKGKVVPVLN